MNLKYEVIEMSSTYTPTLLVLTDEYKFSEIPIAELRDKKINEILDL